VLHVLKDEKLYLFLLWYLLLRMHVLKDEKLYLFLLVWPPFVIRGVLPFILVCACPVG
jgi:hypothetical protein